MIYREPHEVVEVLCEIYTERFGGKRRGRFRLMRVDFRKLAGRRRLHQAIVDDVKNLMMEQGYLMEEVADYFVVIDADVLEGYRKVPRAILEPYLGEGEDDSEPVADDAEDDD